MILRTEKEQEAWYEGVSIGFKRALIFIKEILLECEIEKKQIEKLRKRINDELVKKIRESY